MRARMVSSVQVLKTESLGQYMGLNLFGELIQLPG